MADAQNKNTKDQQQDLDVYKRQTLNGMEWTARSAEDGGSIPEGTVVVVKAVDGVKLIVSPAGQEKTEG